MTPRPCFYFQAAALLCSALFSAAPVYAQAQPDSAVSARIQFNSCRRPEYPRSALNQQEEGISLLGFLVRADGTVADSTVLTSSGSRSLDSAARDALSKCAFTPATIGGVAVERWVPVSYMWVFDDDPGMTRKKRQLALMAGKGSAGVLYHLARVMEITAKTDAERGQALVLLRSAAELGQPHAQFDLGARLEKGEGVGADLEAALDWYRKSAAQGDIVAIQRLQSGYL